MLFCSCSPDFELLALKCRPCFLPRKFTLVSIQVVDITPEESTEAALLDLCLELNCSQTNYLYTVAVVAGHFNQGNPNNVMSDLH